MATDKQQQAALFLFDYMLSKLHAVYRDSGETYGTVNHDYLFEKLDVMVRILGEDFNGDFSKFVKTLEESFDTDYQLTS